MNLIVAVDKNWAIGKENKLLVSIPADMKFFRQETTGKVVVMGRKTLESFPGGLPLKNRTNIVLTRDKNYQAKGAVIVHTLEELLKELENIPQKKFTASAVRASTACCFLTAIRLILLRSITDMKRIGISLIWMRAGNGRLRHPVKNRPTLIWNTVL